MVSGRCLQLDVGNSGIKWRLLEKGCALARGRVADIAELAEHIDIANIAQVQMASVAGDEVDARLLQTLDGLGFGNVVLARSQAFWAEVANAYADPERMGVDRWLAMLAAYDQVSGACVVVDAGSALTIDLLAADGGHVGGYIIPGTRLLVEAFGGTGRVRFGAGGEVSLQPGRNTDDCVHHGKWLVLAGAVEKAMARAEALWGRNYAVVVTGGDGAALMSLLGAQAEGWRFCEELVLDGLSIACDPRFAPGEELN